MVLMRLNLRLALFVLCVGVLLLILLWSHRGEPSKFRTGMYYLSTVIYLPNYNLSSFLYQSMERLRDSYDN